RQTGVSPAKPVCRSANPFGSRQTRLSPAKRVWQQPNLFVAGQTRLSAAKPVCSPAKPVRLPVKPVRLPAKPVWQPAGPVWGPAKPVCRRTNAFARALSRARDQQFLRTGLQPVRPTGEVALREVCGRNMARFAEAALPREGHDLAGSEEADE